MYSLILFIPLLSSILIIIFSRFLTIKGTIFLINNINNILIIIINIIIIEIIIYKTKINITIKNWFFSELFNNDISFIFDKESIIIAYLIINIYAIIIRYIGWYMKEEAHIIRFIIYMNIFSFMMLILTLSKNLIVMLIGWEGVGLLSYLLINYWFTRLQANKSAIKAIIYNKIGDYFLIISIYLYIIYNTNNLNNNFDNIYIIDTKINNILLIGILIATIAKSAQIGLHCWLGDAMEGPTPVSALLHAATMVTAGIYLLYRIIPVTLYNNNVYYYISIIGLLTITIGGLISLYQYDIKKIIAFSTCSQLGYMLYSLSIGLINQSYFHLFIHGFFKALLFLSAGILIHTFFNQQDLRKLSGLIYNFPITYIYFLIGSLSIISFPFLSGFYSKDLILEYTLLSNIFIIIISLLGVLLTISYSIRMFYLLFYTLPKKKNIKDTMHEPFLFHLLLLILGSIFLGFFLKDFFFNPSNYFHILPLYSFDFHHIPNIFYYIPLLLLLLGYIYGIYIDKIIYNIKLIKLINILIFINSIFNKKFYFDYLFNYFFVKSSLFLSFSFFYQLFDKGIYELFSSIGLYRFFFLFSFFKENKVEDSLYSIINSNNTYQKYFYFLIFLFFLIYILLLFFFI